MKRVRGNWTGGAARALYEIELKAKEIRDKLEHGDIELADVDGDATELDSLMSLFVKLIDRAQGLKLAGIK